jgi:GAF domain-containing protein
MSTEPNRETGVEAAAGVGDMRRLNAVRRTELLDTPPEEAFDRLTRIAAALVEAPVTFISIVDELRDFYKSCYGFDATLSESREIRGTTFCHYAITSSEPLVINDTKAHPVYRDVPTVNSLGVAAYLGIPLKLGGGEIIGSFCAIDFEPRIWSDRDVRILSELASSALREIELRQAVQMARQEALEAEKARSLQPTRTIRPREVLTGIRDRLENLSYSFQPRSVDPAESAVG